MELNRTKLVWKCLKNESFPNVDETMIYEMLFKDVEKYQDVWNLPNFLKFRLEDEEFNKFIITPIEVVEGILQCLKCKSNKIFSFSKQTRSGDEPTSVFAKCSNCHHKWVQ